nr:MAG TPA: hypothetical protein [Caudoviricetes sp.]
MGVSAGRVLLIPKGDWNAETTYTCLDWVRHNGSSWVCKNTCTNIEPTEANSDNWQIMARDGTEITVDTAMSDDSENVVQNKVIKKYVDEHTPEVADMTGATATQNGAHGLVPAPQMGDEKKALLGDGTWGSVDAILTYKTKEEYDAAVANDEIPDGAKVIKEYDEEGSTAIIDIDMEMSDTSENPVQNKVIKKYVDDHAPNITVDSGISDTSENPVQNKVIKTYIDNSTTEINNVIQSLSEAIDAKKVPRTLIENIMTMDGGMVLDTGGDYAMLTPKTTWEPDDGGYRISINKCSAGALLVFNVPANVPPKSVVYILVTTLNKEDIKIQGTSNLMENTTDAVTKGQVNVNVQLPTGWTSTIINFMPIVFQNV